MNENCKQVICQNFGTFTLFKLQVLWFLMCVVEYSFVVFYFPQHFCIAFSFFSLFMNWLMLFTSYI